MGYYNSLLKAEFHSPSKWILTEPLIYTNGVIQSHILKEIGIDSTSIECPEGFETDLASIPRPLWSVLSPWDIARAAVIHDYLYKLIRDNDKATYSMRKAADKVFLLAMKDSEPSVPEWKIKIAYYAVRLFGWSAV